MRDMIIKGDFEDPDWLSIGKYPNNAVAFTHPSQISRISGFDQEGLAKGPNQPSDYTTNLGPLMVYYSQPKL